MNWDKGKSILLSQIGTVCFAVLLLALDIGSYFFSMVYVANQMYHGKTDPQMMRDVWLMMQTILSGSVLGWIFLYRLWKLLRSIKRGEVFTEANVRRMRAMSWCCMGAAAICLASTLYYLPFLFIALAAGFTGLIVRVVKNVFQQAIAMKDELDLTV